MLPCTPDGRSMAVTLRPFIFRILPGVTTTEVLSGTDGILELPWQTGETVNQDALEFEV